MFPYPFDVQSLADALKIDNLKQVLFNLPAGNWDAGGALPSFRMGDGNLKREWPKQSGMPRPSTARSSTVSWDSGLLAFQSHGYGTSLRPISVSLQMPSDRKVFVF